MTPERCSTWTQEWLSEVVELSGGSILYYPKFHCEFNWMERGWADAKCELRKLCDFTFPSLKTNFPLAVDRVTPDAVNTYFMHAVRYMHCYHGADGRMLTPAMIAFAMHKYRGHRCIPPTVFADFDAEYSAKRGAA